MAIINYYNCLKFASLALICASLSSCKVGPNFHSPAPPTTNKYTALPLPQQTIQVAKAGKAGTAQLFLMGRDIPGQWWTLFHSSQLNRLIEEGIANNPNLQASEDALIRARELLRAQVGESYYPSIGLDVEGQRTRETAFRLGLPTARTFDLYTADIQGTYLLDLFGKERRLVESVQAELEFERYEMLAAYLSLTANIATSYIEIASLQALIQTTHKLIKDQKKILSIVKQQYHVGGASEEDIIAQETLLAQTQATLPPLRKDLSLAKHTLAILVGKFPSQLALRHYRLESLQLPRRLPVTLPSVLVTQRPDIQASQALLHKASAEVGVATANLFPQILIKGNVGWVGDMLSAFFNSKNSIWAYGAQILQPIFEGGSLIAKKRAAVAAFHQSAEQYRKTLLNAFKEVSNALRSIEFDAKEFLEQYKAEASANRTLIITQQQFRVGGTNYLNVLNAEEQYQQTKLNRIKAQAARYRDTTELFRALGGGWWNNPINMTSLKLAGEKNPSLPAPKRIGK